VNKLFRKILITLFFLTFTTLIYPAEDSELSSREFIIDGLRIFKQRELRKILNLDPLVSGKEGGKKAADIISRFYRKNGYTLIKIHIVEDSDERLALYVNEGRLAKIVVHGLNNYYSLKVKQLIDFPCRIYNTEIEEQNIDRIKKKYKFPVIRTELKKIADYSESFFQIDRELKRIAFLQNNIKIFNDFPPEYDLHLYPGKSSKTKGLRIEKNGISFNIDYDYPSLFIPEISYYKNNIFYGKDYLELNFSSGFNPGIKGFVSYPPSNTLLFPPDRSFSRINGEYKINPFMNDIFGPVIIEDIYQSKSSRTDLGIERYKYLRSKTTLAPEFTLLKYFNIYAGFGYEKVYFYDTKTDETSEEEINIDNGLENYPFLESRIKLDPIPIRLGNRLNKHLKITLTEYFGNRHSRELKMECVYDFEFSSLSIYSLRLNSVLNFYDTPFHHNSGVSSKTFKGFHGEGYYTNKDFAVSNEYRFSVYQDYIYAGAFVDYVIFEPEGSFLSGTKQGVAAGPVGRFLFYDQFELIVYYSFDRLFPDGTKGTNLQLKFRKKW